MKHVDIKPVQEAASAVFEGSTLYKRPLSDKLIRFSSKEGMKLFNESMQAGYMHNYFPLAEQFTT